MVACAVTAYASTGPAASGPTRRPPRTESRTTVARTLLDMADVLNSQALKRAIDEAEYQRLFDLNALTATVNNNPGRRGSTLLEVAADPSQLTRSEFENRFLGFCARHKLPAPRTNRSGVRGRRLLAGRQPDRRARRLRRRSTRRAFQADRERDRRLIAAGFRAIRLTPLDLANGRSVARALRGLLKSRMTVERSRPGERWFER